MEIRKKYEEMIPGNRILYSLSEIEKMGLIKVSMLKKLLSNGSLEAITIGVKYFITKTELLRFLVENTIKRIDPKDEK